MGHREDEQEDPDEQQAPGLEKDQARSKVDGDIRKITRE
jgi:hypothetical protein